ncbi:hypothetical protein D3C73_799100 [compost metagenome]
MAFLACAVSSRRHGICNTTIQLTNASPVLERWPKQRSGRRKFWRSHLADLTATPAGAISDAGTSTMVSATKCRLFTMAASGCGPLNRNHPRSGRWQRQQRFAKSRSKTTFCISPMRLLRSSHPQFNVWWAYTPSRCISVQA